VKWIQNLKKEKLRNTGLIPDDDCVAIEKVVINALGWFSSSTKKEKKKRNNKQKRENLKRNSEVIAITENQINAEVK